MRHLLLAVALISSAAASKIEGPIVSMHEGPPLKAEVSFEMVCKTQAASMYMLNYPGGGGDSMKVLDIAFDNVPTPEIAASLNELISRYSNVGIVSFACYPSGGWRLLIAGLRMDATTDTEIGSYEILDVDVSKAGVSRVDVIK